MLIIHSCIYTYAHICTYVIYTIYSCIHTHMHTHAHMIYMLTTHVYIHTCTYIIHADYTFIHTYAHTCTHIIHVDYTFIHTLICTHTYICNTCWPLMYTYTHMHTHVYMMINHSHLPSSFISRPPYVDNPSLLLTNLFLTFMPFSLFYDPVVLTRSVSVTKTLELSTGICWDHQYVHSSRHWLSLP